MTRYALTTMLLLSLSGCGLLTEPLGTCPWTYENNYGCARLVVVPGPLPPNLPSSYRWNVAARGESAESMEFGRHPLPEQLELRLTLWLPLPGDADTDTVTVVAQILDDSGPIVVNVPLPLVAVDSVRQAVRFARVGRWPPVVTVRLNMRAVSGQ
jgi:hypothetical protein